MDLLVRNLPILPMREDVIFPLSQTPFFIGRKASMQALEKAIASNREIVVVSQINANIDSPNDQDLLNVGVYGTILQVMRLPNGTIKALFDARQRAIIVETSMTHGEYEATVELIEEPEDFENSESLKLSAVQVYQNYISTLAAPPKYKTPAFEGIQASKLVDLLMPNLEDLKKEKKQILLETVNAEERLKQFIQILSDEVRIRHLGDEFREQAQSQAKSFQKEGYLQDQLKSIQKELGQQDDSRQELEELAQQIEETPMSEDAKEVAIKELKKLKLMSPMSSESTVVRNYLEWLLAMPWNQKTEDHFDLGYAQKILDQDHFGLDKVKERIVEYLAVAQLKGNLKGPVICLVGPPGVGKTSLAKSIARALKRNFVHMSLGGVRDEAEIRGHRRTYIGALPGKLIQSLRKSKSQNPVLLMDEIDKLTQSATGDPSAALLEVLDPEQNKNFIDHYLDVEYDLSDVLFLCTANSTQSISGPLLDRMEVIPLPGYTELEKEAIAQEFLIPKQCELHGLDGEQIQFQPKAVADVIQLYTREAGVRNLERELGKICRKVVTKTLKQESTSLTKITPKSLQSYLGVPVFQEDEFEETSEVGVSTGLGVTSLGGQKLMVEVGAMKGNGKLMLTGKLGDVMQESAKAAYSYARANAGLLGIETKVFKHTDLHIHIPEGAMPKDGPSAGLPLVTAIVSALTQIPVRHDVAMTGEITLRGYVHEIGGLKEKLLAAKRAGIKAVVIPEDNVKDLSEIPNEIKKSLTIHPVPHIHDALRLGLTEAPNALQDAQDQAPGAQAQESLV